MSFDQREDFYEAQRSRRAFERNKMKPTGQSIQKQRAWSHQKDLEKLQGKNIVIGLTSGHLVEGVLIDADQFTLKIAIVGAGNSAVYFKSILTYFREV